MVVNTGSTARLAAAISAALGLVGCVGLAPDRGYVESRELVQQMRPNLAFAAPESAPKPDIPATPIRVDDAVQLAFFNNPRLQEIYARLGFARAELDEARRISNPSFGYLRLRPEAGSGRQVTRSLSLGLTDLLMLPARKRYAEGDLVRVQTSVASALVELAAEVEVAWYEAVGAQQVANMRELVANAAENSAVLAQRFHQAGNISLLEKTREQANATQARIAAVRAAAEAARARHHLATLMGLPSAASWRTEERLAAPPESTLKSEPLVQLALENRLDLRAAQQEVALRESAVALNKRWGWLGGIELGVEREREFDGARTRGAFIDLELPLFNQGQGKRARARAELLQARAELTAHLLAVRNDTTLGLEAMQALRDIAERYRSELVPQRETVVSESQKQQNYMLIGVFELLMAKQEEYDAYQEYLETVRDYWIARAQLRKAVGGRLPDDGEALTPALGVPEVQPQSADPHAGHHMPEQTQSADPHAGHHMPEQTQSADPHAGHHMPEQTQSADPHAGHHMPEQTQSADPHAGHHMPEQTQSADPHAGHHMPEQTQSADPHAGHHMPEQTQSADPHAGHHMPAEPSPSEEPKAEDTPHHHPQQGARP